MCKGNVSYEMKTDCFIVETICSMKSFLIKFAFPRPTNSYKGTQFVRLLQSNKGVLINSPCICAFMV